ncbi:SapC family protein [Thiocystis violacea]|uniref:SapC family protein n=1 Tax=Thiocystis violacea TaxID=13725 RepID=UPI001902CCAE|nr:SapC family protein [Thiocystis violacea]
MSTIVPVSRQRHGKTRLRSSASYLFASQSSLAVLVAAEMSKAAMALPIAFIRQADAYLPVALMSLKPDTNLMVAHDGRWLARYVPSALHAYPFSLGKAEGDTRVLCVDEDSGLLTDGIEGEPFFDVAGAASDSLVRRLDLLRKIERSRLQTGHACELLASQELIRPWRISITEGASERQVEGLFQIDESVLNEISDEVFLELRRLGALPMAYCQLLSMQNLPLLYELADARRNRSSFASSGGDFSLQCDEQLRFDWG